MKEFYAEKAGRYLSLEDVENLNDLAVAWGEVFKPFGNFIASGCTPDYDVSTNTLFLSGGYVFLYGKLCKLNACSVKGKTCYIVMQTSSENAEYVDGTSNKCRNIYTASAVTSVASSDQYVTISVVENNGEFEYDYPTFTSVLSETKFVPRHPTPIYSDNPIDVYGFLRVFRLLFANSTASIRVNGNSIEISGYENGTRPGIIILEDGSVNIVDDINDGTDPSEDAYLRVGHTQINTIVPLNFTSMTNDDNGRPVSSNGEVNVAGILKMNGKELVTKELVKVSICEDYRVGTPDNYEGLYAELTFGRIGPVVTVNGYFRSDDYDRESNTEVEFDVDILAEDNYRPAINVQFPVSINVTDMTAIERNYTGYIRMTKDGKCYMGVNTHSTEETPYYWHNLKVYISGSYVADAAFD